VKRRRRIEVTVETERVFAVIPLRPTRPAWCGGCGAEVEMLTILDAAARAGRSAQTVCAWAEAGELHAQVTADGVLLVCAPTLYRRQQAG
jgi:hypothetical protein